MERITISLPDDLAARLDDYINRRGYENRSEAMRDLIRERLETESLDQSENRPCVGALTYVFNHRERDLAARLTDAQHRHHDLAVSTLHVHLDHDNCLETVILTGPSAPVRAFANAVMARPGIRHGKLFLIPIEVDEAEHNHGHGIIRHRHMRPQT